MAERKVQVFFYGSFISLKVLEAAGLKKRAFAPACIVGYELVISPVANISEAGDSAVYGILANVTHKELDALYQVHLNTLTDNKYYPEATIVHTRGGKVTSALVYICAGMKPANPDNAYVDKILQAASSYGFPGWYLEHIEKFKS